MKAAAFLLAVSVCGQSWVPQQSGTAASLRGVSAVDDRIVWASGAGGTVLRTLDGGANWTATVVPGAAGLDFRDVEAFSDRVAFLMSAGPGDKSRIYRTLDGGASWTLIFTNPDPSGFFDCIAFWNRKSGMIAGDPVNGRAAVFVTSDEGQHWTRRETPPALAGEGSFAASGTCLIAPSARSAWLATGGTGAGRVLQTDDRGQSWRAANTGLRNDSASSGVFSIAVHKRQAVAVGGDYNKPKDTRANAALTTDGGLSWRQPKGAPPSGFRSAVTYVAPLRLWIATGTDGSDLSRDGGESWQRFDDGAYNALSFSKTGSGWAVGPQGRIARFAPASKMR